MIKRSIMSAMCVLLVSSIATVSFADTERGKVCATPKGGIGYVLQMQNMGSQGNDTSQPVSHIHLAGGRKCIDANPGDIIRFRPVAGSSTFKFHVTNKLTVYSPDGEQLPLNFNVDWSGTIWHPTHTVTAD